MGPSISCYDKKPFGCEFPELLFRHAIRIAGTRMTRFSRGATDRNGIGTAPVLASQSVVGGSEPKQDCTRW